METELASTSRLPPGTRFGSYEVVRLIGAGGMGAVYEALHVGLKKRVALKTLHAAVRGNDEVVARFLREGEAASRIQHPNVVDMTDLGVHEGTPFLVMEYLEGESLSRLLARDAPLSPERTLAVMLPVMAAVAAAHDEGVVHRDLKPENIFLARNRLGVVEPKLLDFGISKISSTVDLTKTASFLGTPQYISPEQAQGSKHVDGRADQYALGVILTKCLTGSLPASSDNLLALLHKVALGQLTRPRELRPDLPEALDLILMRAMALEPSARYAHVAVLGEVLLAFADDPTRAAYGPYFRGRASEIRGGKGPSRPPPELLAAAEGELHDTAQPLASMAATDVRRFARQRSLRSALGLALPLVALACAYLWYVNRGEVTEARATPVPAAAAVSASPTPEALPSSPPPSLSASPIRQGAPSPSPSASAAAAPSAKPSGRPAAPPPQKASPPRRSFNTGTNDAPIVD
ncbi:MAG: serine/threonine-protein kinase [Myxococcota bacterium]